MLARPEVWDDYKVTIVSAFESQCEKRGRWPKAGYSAKTEPEKTQAVDLTQLIDVS